jgi:hypothetical protein
MSIDTPEERAAHKRAFEKAEAALPVIYETNVDGKRYRIRGYINGGEISGSICEWLYMGKWLRMWNYEISSRLKELWQRERIEHGG